MAQKKEIKELKTILIPASAALLPEQRRQSEGLTKPFNRQQRRAVCTKCVCDHLDSNPICKIPRRIVSFQERKLTYFNTFTFLSFFFLFDPTLVVFTRLFRCAFFLLTPVMSNTKHEEVKITRRSLRDWKSTEHKSVQIPSFSPDRRKWRQGLVLQGK